MTNEFVKLFGQTESELESRGWIINGLAIHRGKGSYAEGRGAISDGENSIALGRGSWSVGKNSSAIGDKSWDIRPH